jgi:hypothetical protein
VCVAGSSASDRIVGRGCGREPSAGVDTLDGRWPRRPAADERRPLSLPDDGVTRRMT